MNDNFKHFESWQSFHNFQSEIRQEARYIHSAKTTKFLETVLATAQDLITPVPKGAIYWRAQLGCDWSSKEEDAFPVPYKKERMKPRIDRANEGRVNPKGIPCLYMAFKRETALAEVRPWVGAKISVSPCKINKELRVINCFSNTRPKIFVGEPTPEKRTEIVWEYIDRAFSEPVNPEDDIADYVPTQIIAELFKQNGFDGIAYGSSLGEDYNLALFKIDNADISNAELHEVKQVCLNFKKIDGPY